jgi:hypothetical protein
MNKIKTKHRKEKQGFLPCVEGPFLCRPHPGTCFGVALRHQGVLQRHGEVHTRVCGRPNAVCLSRPSGQRLLFVLHSRHASRLVDKSWLCTTTATTATPGQVPENCWSPSTMDCFLPVKSLKCEQTNKTDISPTLLSSCVSIGMTCIQIHEVLEKLWLKTIMGIILLHIVGSISRLAAFHPSYFLQIVRLIASFIAIFVHAQLHTIRQTPHE